MTRRSIDGARFELRLGKTGTAAAATAAMGVGQGRKGSCQPRAGATALRSSAGWEQDVLKLSLKAPALSWIASS